MMVEKNKLLGISIVVLVLSMSVTSVPLYLPPAIAQTANNFSAPKKAFHPPSMAPPSMSESPINMTQVILAKNSTTPSMYVGVVNLDEIKAGKLTKNIPDNKKASLNLGKGHGFFPYRQPTHTASTGKKQKLSNDGNCSTYPCSNLNWNGGPVMHNARIFLVFWDPNWVDCTHAHFEGSQIDSGATDNDCGYINKIWNYFNEVCTDGPLMAELAQYTDNSGSAGPCYVYQDGVHYSPLIDTDPYPGTHIHQNQIANEAQNILHNYYGLLEDGNTEIFMYLPYGADPCISNDDSSCFHSTDNSWCAYHNYYASGSLQATFAVMPDLGDNTRVNCGVDSLHTPNHLPFTDAEISTTSHEQWEAITDPYFNAYLSSNNYEIGDECGYDFYGTEPDNSNVRLGTSDSPFRIQTEWSNHNGGCTFDLNGAAANTLFHFYPDTKTGTTATYPNYGFPIDYVEAGETYSSENTSFPAFDGYSIYSTPNYQMSLSATSGIDNTEFWCFNSSCSSQIATPTADSTVTNYFYDMVSEPTAVLINYGGTPTINLSYKTAPASASSTDNIQTTTLALSSTTKYPLVLRGSVATVPSCTPFTTVCASEDWATPSTQPNSWFITGYLEISDPIQYNHQYFLTMSSSPTGGGSTTSSGYVNAVTSKAIVATPTAGYQFSSWRSSTGSITIASPTSSSTTATVGGVGTLTANFVKITNPKITLSPTRGPVGTKVTVSGSGFAPSSSVTIKYAGVVKPIPGLTTNTTGSFSATITISPSTAGSHTVTANDAAAHTSFASFKVSSKITVSPTSGPSGTVVTVSGTGFGPSSAVTIKYDGVVQTISPTTTSAVGSFSVTFTVPLSTAGSHTVTASDAVAHTASAKFNRT